MTDWISVEERLPEKTVAVLVASCHTGPHGPQDWEYVVAEWWDWRNEPIWIESLNGEFMPNEGTHWMPLPEGPE